MTFEGKHYQVRRAVCEPRPNPIPPVVVGCRRPRMLRLAARYADEWDVSSLDARRYAVLAANFEQACAAVGRDPSTVGQSWSGGCACAPTEQEAQQLAADRLDPDPDGKDFDFVGAPDQIVEQMRPFIALGVRHFKLDCVDFPSLRGLDLLINDVLPALNT